jgi:hypothetical protein
MTLEVARRGGPANRGRGRRRSSTPAPTAAACPPRLEGACTSGSSTIAEVVQGVEPMGDLRRFRIDDLIPEEEDES